MGQDRAQLASLHLGRLSWSDVVILEQDGVEVALATRDKETARVVDGVNEREDVAAQVEKPQPFSGTLTEPAKPFDVRRGLTCHVKGFRHHAQHVDHRVKLQGAPGLGASGVALTQDVAQSDDAGVCGHDAVEVLEEGFEPMSASAVSCSEQMGEQIREEGSQIRRQTIVEGGVGERTTRGEAEEAVPICNRAIVLAERSAQERPDKRCEVEFATTLDESVRFGEALQDREGEKGRDKFKEFSILHGEKAGRE